MPDPNARYYPTLKVTLSPALPMHDAVHVAEELRPRLEAWLAEQGYTATVIQPR